MDLLHRFGLSKWVAEQAGQLPFHQDWSEEELQRRLTEQIPDLSEGPRGRIMEPAALAAYHAESGHMRLLVCDDARQFKLVADELALCWIHDGRHYQSISEHDAVCTAASGIDRHADAITNLLRKCRRTPVMLSAARLPLNQPLSVNQLLPQNLTSTRPPTRKTTQLVSLSLSYPAPFEAVGTGTVPAAGPACQPVGRRKRASAKAPASRPTDRCQSV